MQLENRSIKSDYWIFDDDISPTMAENDIPRTTFTLSRQQSGNLHDSNPPPPITSRISNLQSKTHKPNKRVSGPVYRISGKEYDYSQTAEMIEASRNLIKIYRQEQYRKALQKKLVLVGSLPRIRRYGELVRRPRICTVSLKMNEDEKCSRESATTLNEENRISSCDDKTQTAPAKVSRMENKRSTSPIKVKFRAKDQPGYNFGAKISTWMKRLAITPNKDN